MIQKKEFENGFKYLQVNNTYANAKIALQGAHIFEYTPLNKKSLLWVSNASNFNYGESIRGGIPICWPWFGMHSSNKAFPQHGFARTALWEFVDSKEFVDYSQITLALQSSDETKKLFPYNFELRLTLCIGKELKMKLTTKNCDEKSFKITQALHTYFNISDTSNISIKGLEGKPYLDALDIQYKVQNSFIKIDKEVDRVFQEVNSEIKLIDIDKIIHINNKGSTSVVIWNPWIEKCSRMSAMNKDSYKTFICIETANALKDEQEIKANQSHTLQTTISFF